jgi:hypothetical protein
MPEDHQSWSSRQRKWGDLTVFILLTANVLWVLFTVSAIVWTGRTGWLLANGLVVVFATLPLVLIYLSRTAYLMFFKEGTQTTLRTPSNIAFLILVVSHILLAVVGRIFEV